MRFTVQKDKLQQSKRFLIGAGDEFNTVKPNIKTGLVTVITGGIDKLGASEDNDKKWKTIRIRKKRKTTTKINKRKNMFHEKEETNTRKEIIVY